MGSEMCIRDRHQLASSQHAMAGNVLWTSVFNKPGSQSQELTRQRIVQEERPGRRPAMEPIPGAQYDAMLRGEGERVPRDPWQKPPPGAPRHTLGAPICGYGGAVPRLYPEHLGKPKSEAHAAYVDKSQGYKDFSRSIAPGGGSSALGTKPMPVPGAKAVPRAGIYDTLKLAEVAGR
mgnify:CR=1 FL=1